MPPKFSSADRSRLSLYKMANGNPQAIIVALDEIKRLAAASLQTTLDSAVAKFEGMLQDALDTLEPRARQVMDNNLRTFVSTLQGELEKRIALIPPREGPPGPKGDRPTIKELRDLVLLLMPEPKHGKDGLTPTAEHLRSLMLPLISTELANRQLTAREQAEADKRLDDRILGMVKKELGGQINEVKQFSGGGGTGPNPTPINNITTDGGAGKELTGAINGSNTVFVLPRTPKKGSERVFLNGVRMRSGASNDYTISAKTITFNTAPQTGDSIVVDIDAGY